MAAKGLSACPKVRGAEMNGSGGLSPNTGRQGCQVPGGEPGGSACSHPRPPPPDPAGFRDPGSWVLEIHAGRQAAWGLLQPRNLLTPEECEAVGVSPSLVVAGNGKFSVRSRPLVPHRNLFSLGLRLEKQLFMTGRQPLSRGTGTTATGSCCRGETLGSALNTRRSGNLVRGAG